MGGDPAGRLEVVLRKLAKTRNCDAASVDILSQLCGQKEGIGLRP